MARLLAALLALVAVAAVAVAQPTMTHSPHHAPGRPVALAVSNVTSTGFQASWSVVDSACEDSRVASQVFATQAETTVAYGPAWDNATAGPEVRGNGALRANLTGLEPGGRYYVMVEVRDPCGSLSQRSHSSVLCVRLDPSSPACSSPYTTATATTAAADPSSTGPCVGVKDCGYTQTGIPGLGLLGVLLGVALLALAVRRRLA